MLKAWLGSKATGPSRVAEVKAALKAKGLELQGRATYDANKHQCV